MKTHSSYHKKTTLKETLTLIVLEIIKNKRLSVIVGNQIDAKVIEKVRKLANLKNIIEISSDFQSTRKPSINMDIDLDFEEDETFLALTDIKKASPLLFSNIENFKQNDGELYTSFMSQDLFESYLGNNHKLLRNIIEGKILFSENPTFISADLFTQFIPSFVKRFVIDAPNLALYLNQPLRITKHKLNTIYLNLDAKLKQNNRITTNICLIGSSLDKFVNTELFINTTSFWNDKRIYFDHFGQLVFTHRVHPIQENVTILDILGLLHSKLLKFI